MNCKNCLKLKSAYVDGNLDARVRVELEAHLVGCPNCREQVNREIRLVASLRDMGSHRTPVDVWPAISGRVAEVERARAQSRAGRRIRLIALPTFAAAGAAVFAMLFLHSDEGQRVTPNGQKPAQANVQKANQEYMEYVQAYSQFQSSQSLDSDSMKLAAELSREKAWRGE